MRTVSALAFAVVFPLVAVACGLDDGTVSILDGSRTGTDAGKHDDAGHPILSDGGPVGDDGSAPSDSGDPPDVATPPDKPLVWAASATDLYSLEVTTGKLVKRGTFACGGQNPLALAVDPAGALLALTSTPDGDRYLVDLSVVATCSAPRKMDSKSSLALAFQGSGVSANLFALRSNSKDLELVQRATGNDDTFQSNVLPHDAAGDFTCSGATCWVVGTAGSCMTAPPTGSSCLGQLTIGASTASYTELGSFPIARIGGIAYHGGNIYLFSGATGVVSVLNITTLATTPIATIGDPPPPAWVGAGSSSSYP
ncbi:MAG: hypothetical protein ABI551_18365 [Polyangiaceae bacterium]